MHIKDLELTENDFKLIIDGLDTLPEKGFAGEIMSGLFEGMLGDKSPEAAAKWKAEREKEKIKKEAQKDQLKEDIKILQGKLLLFKRWLIEQDALKQVNQFLTK